MENSTKMEFTNTHFPTEMFHPVRFVLTLPPSPAHVRNGLLSGSGVRSSIGLLWGPNPSLLVSSATKAGVRTLHHFSSSALSLFFCVCLTWRKETSRTSHSAKWALIFPFCRMCVTALAVYVRALVGCVRLFLYTFVSSGVPIQTNKYVLLFIFFVVVVVDTRCTQNINLPAVAVLCCSCGRKRWRT